MKPAGKQATHCTIGEAATDAHWEAGGGLIRLTVTVEIVEENEYDVTVVDTTNWFLLMKKSRFALKCWSVVDVSP
jgi:hypothetical protein